MTPHHASANAPLNLNLRPLSAALTWVMLVGVVVAWLSVLRQGVFVRTLWEDEAYNLTVPRNLVAGLGYASDGIAAGSGITPFDVWISTGPVMLLPVALLHWMGVEIVLAGRLVGAFFGVLLAVGLYFVGSRLQRGSLFGPLAPRPNTVDQIDGTPQAAGAWSKVAGFLGRLSWVGLIAAAAPLAFDSWQTPSPIQSPADVLGEFAAAAFIVWAVFFASKRPLIAGLMVGLAMQCKFMSLLSLPAIALALFLCSTAPMRRRLISLCWGLLGVIIPNALYELWVLVSLGPSGYQKHVEDFITFLQIYDATKVPAAAKVELLTHAWFLPSAALLGLTAFMLILASGVYFNGRPLRWRSILGQRNQIVLTAIIGFLTFVGWWVSSTTAPLWIRHPAIGVLAFYPLLLAAVAALIVEGGRRVTHRPAVLASLAGLLVTGVLGWQVFAQITKQVDAPVRTLAQQRSIAAEIDNDQQEIAAQWGSSVSIAFLATPHIHVLRGDPGATAQWERIVVDLPVDGCEAPRKTSQEFMLCPSLDEAQR